MFFSLEKRLVSELLVRSGRNSGDALPNLFSCFFFAQQRFLLIYSTLVSWKKVCFLSIEYFSIFPLKELSGLCLVPAMLSLLQKKLPKKLLVNSEKSVLVSKQKYVHHKFWKLATNYISSFYQYCQKQTHRIDISWNFL